MISTIGKKICTANTLKNDDELYERMYEINGEYIHDERAKLDIQLPTAIIIVGDIGR